MIPTDEKWKYHAEPGPVLRQALTHRHPTARAARLANKRGQTRTTLSFWYRGERPQVIAGNRKQTLVAQSDCVIVQTQLVPRT